MFKFQAQRLNLLGISYHVWFCLEHKKTSKVATVNLKGSALAKFCEIDNKWGSFMNFV